MGWFNNYSPVESAEQEVRRCERHLAVMKENRDNAKRSGSYKSAAKNHGVGGKVGTTYDANVWTAENALKQAKAKLAKAKADAKKKK